MFSNHKKTMVQNLIKFNISRYNATNSKADDIKWILDMA